MVDVAVPPVPAASALGKSIPADIPHAVSVSLPRWQDNIDYEEGRLGDVLETGYPRFFIHRSIQKLAAHVNVKFAQPHETCLLLPTARAADRCRAFMQDHHARQPSSSNGQLAVRITQFCLVAPSSKGNGSLASSTPCLSTGPEQVSVYIVLFPKQSFPLAKAFWQHAGDGISSRLAEKCLQIIAETARLTSSTTTSSNNFRNRHYSKPMNVEPKLTADDAAALDQSIYVEERFGRNLPLTSAELAKSALRRRIAGTLLADRQARVGDERPTEEQLASAEASSRHGTGASERDVWLYPCGMSAIFHAHQIAMLERSMQELAVGKSICFGFPYTDTLKILQKWGPGCHHYGHGNDADLDQLERDLAARDASTPPILALFCEFPSNPLLRSPDLIRLRKLANEHKFLIVVDETIGNFVNVEVLPYADMVVSSLTKVFSGDTNVMGGSLVLNPLGPRAETLRKAVQLDFEDMYWGEDAIFMERNSRDFIARVDRINKNAEALCEMLRRESERPATERVVKAVQYPKYETRQYYDACRRTTSLGSDESIVGGYGGLFSIFFPSEAIAEVFYDMLSCAKGPSLGTNFTLASPYAILAHYTELDWAAQFGVERTLIRVSVGLEDAEVLLRMFSDAAEAARKKIQS